MNFFLFLLYYFRFFFKYSRFNRVSLLFSFRCLSPNSPFFSFRAGFFFSKTLKNVSRNNKERRSCCFLFDLLWLFLVNNTVYFSVLFVTGRGLHTLLLWLLTSLPFRASIIAGSNEYKGFFSSHVFPLLHSSSFIIAVEAAPCHSDSHSFLVFFSVLFFTSF